jgi:hypothetical protein
LKCAKNSYLLRQLKTLKPFIYKGFSVSCGIHEQNVEPTKAVFQTDISAESLSQYGFQPVEKEEKLVLEKFVLKKSPHLYVITGRTFKFLKM